mmetsp:Transcript_400/g.397  ORF Transcript_400/g.397 Transcript_400/m.397 type:complete len:219 (+) Transcript_400:236-892(+)
MTGLRSEHRGAPNPSVHILADGPAVVMQSEARALLNSRHDRFVVELEFSDKVHHHLRIKLVKIAVFSLVLQMRQAFFNQTRGELAFDRVRGLLARDRNSCRRVALGLDELHRELGLVDDGIDPVAVLDDVDENHVAEVVRHDRLSDLEVVLDVQHVDVGRPEHAHVRVGHRHEVVLVDNVEVVPLLLPAEHRPVGLAHVRVVRYLVWVPSPTLQSELP